ncbi:MAG: FAD:protein FMN transferase [Planctomycetota bacterium]|nr:FAD:protein FMN transferase [Planctomycetota bacterium]
MFLFTNCLCLVLTLLTGTVEAQNSSVVNYAPTSHDSGSRVAPGAPFSEAAVSESSTETGEKSTEPLLPRRLFEDLWHGGEIVVDGVTLPMEGELRSQIARKARVAVNSDPVRLFRVQSESSGQKLGHVLVLDEVGKYRPITFLVALNNEDRVLDLQVLVYREHIGRGIESSRFTRQFRNKNSGSKLKLHRDIRNLAGATLSARAAVRAVRRALATVQLTVRSADMELDWQRRDGDRLIDSWSGSDAGTAEPVETTAVGEVPESQLVSRARPAMGTILRIDGHGQNAAEAISLAYDEVERIEALLSRWRPDSDILRIERAPAGTAVKVSATTIRCVREALDAAVASDGVFDPTLVPDGYQKILIDEVDSTITLMEEDLILDLGGIGKGFALDRAAELLESNGLNSVLLDFGGQLLALDPPPGQSAWDVAIFDPRSSGALLGSVPLVRASIATSSGYERGDHIIDPHKQESISVALSTTILANRATSADAMSTTLAVLGPEHAERFLETVSGGGAVILVEGEDSPRTYGHLRH